MTNFEAVDATDNAWRFCLSTRMTGAYPKPVLLRSSWHRFVEQKGLAPEDRVVFFMERDEANDIIRRYTYYQKLAKYQRNPRRHISVGIFRSKLPTEYFRP